MAPSGKQLLQHSPKRSCSSDGRGSSVLTERDYQACYLGRGSGRRWLRLRLFQRVTVLARASTGTRWSSGRAVDWGGRPERRRAALAPLARQALERKLFLTLL